MKYTREVLGQAVAESTSFAGVMRYYQGQTGSQSHVVGGDSRGTTTR
ncbi:hypothetical protein SAMN04490220_2797 [Rhodococcus jostii]|uniref:Uncharacterized protein n=1 Tax=Rhodococcus jostii TaxID=132919 RepID=A0A1H4W0P6_RHOJO|nr:hypothetical protein SAMN04490220_2797 [Rhodococcus jostii]